jgi:hypothetical protein
MHSSSAKRSISSPPVSMGLAVLFVIIILISQGHCA